MTGQTHPVGYSHVRWPDPETGPWLMICYFRTLGGVEQCVGLELWNGTEPAFAPIDREVRDLAGGPSTIRAAAVREIPVSKLIEQARAARVDAKLELAAAMRQRLVELGEEPGLVASDADIAGAAGRPRRGRRPLYDRDHFLRVATIYLDALINDRHPTQAVVDAFQVSRATAAHWVARCRRPPLNLLDETDRGKAKGLPEEE